MIFLLESFMVEDTQDKAYALSWQFRNLTMGLLPAQFHAEI